MTSDEVLGKYGLRPGLVPIRPEPVEAFTFLVAMLMAAPVFWGMAKLARQAKGRSAPGSVWRDEGKRSANPGLVNLVKLG